ncbi:MAG: DUF6151 family protein [Pseudobdellovibrionaceae bacterium]|nr:DUF6151 family protein [Pseudobdellovibrionaceae bacterium]
MNDHVSLKCSCGKFRGRIDLAGMSSKRAVCLCDDCQAFAHHLGRAKEVLDANGGTDIYTCYPSHLEFTQGADQVKCLRLSPKGLLRWYAGCCKTPIANSPPSSRMPYVGVVHTIMDHAADATTHEEALGPVHMRIQGKFGIGPLPPGTDQKVSLPAILVVLRFLTSGWLRRKQQPSPFFDSKGQMRVTPYVLTRDERVSLRKLCGPA